MNRAKLQARDVTPHPLTLPSPLCRSTQGPREREGSPSLVFLHTFLACQSMLASALIMSPIVHFLTDVWVRTHRAAIARWRATNLATHLSTCTQPCAYLPAQPPISLLSHQSPWSYLSQGEIGEIHKQQFLNVSLELLTVETLNSGSSDKTAVGGNTFLYIYFCTQQGSLKPLLNALQQLYVS